MNWKHLIIKRLGGYPTVEDAVDAVKEKELSKRILFLNAAVKRLYNTIGADDILQERNGTWMVEGKPLREDMKKILIAEAAYLQNMKLWKILTNDVKYQANKKMFLLAKDEVEMTAGKLWTYTLDAMITRLKSLSKGSGTFNSR